MLNMLLMLHKLNFTVWNCHGDLFQLYIQYRQTLSVPSGAICTNRESSLISSHCATLANFTTYRDWRNIAIYRAVFRHTPAISPLGKARYIAENRAESTHAPIKTRYKRSLRSVAWALYVYEYHAAVIYRENVNIARYIALYRNCTLRDERDKSRVALNAIFFDILRFI